MELNSYNDGLKEALPSINTGFFSMIQQKKHLLFFFVGLDSPAWVFLLTYLWQLTPWELAVANRQLGAWAQGQVPGDRAINNSYSQ